ncbi:MAG: carboxypeptidase-like regulatory domain-containing protein [Candidatus Shapirobacteria bacterium]|nr:carboxypeptidase-like regulatory domain-containing protein [Candidatus Shapirobacteria bacterium]
MEQHAIPQQISSYEFKLVGDMTLKQFLKAAGGIILAIIINSTKMVVLVKWPLMFLFGAGGLALAFIPFEDRPLESWIISFIKAIYSPTVYIYKRKANKNWLDLDLSKNTNENEEDLVVQNIREKRKMSVFGEKIKDSISVMGAKTAKKEEVKPISQNPSKSPFDLKGDLKTIEIKTEEKTILTNDWRDQKTDLNLKTERLEATGSVVFGAIPMPDIPDVANVVVGMATNNEGKIIDGVIIEIQDENGNPSRVLKTNSLGQFKTTTPLASGRYLIIAEKDGYNFDRVNIDLNGQIVQPVKIIANN